MTTHTLLRRIQGASLPLWCVVLLLCSVDSSWAQQELRSGTKGSNAASPVTSTSLGANGQALDVNQGTLTSCENQGLNECYTSDAGLVARYTSTGDKNVSGSAGEIVGLLAASGTSVTAVIYDDGDGVCSSTQLSGTLSLTNGSFLKFPSRHSTGICITIGGTSPDVTVFYKKVGP